MVKKLDLPLDIKNPVEIDFWSDYIFGPNEKDIEIREENFSACTLLFHLYDCKKFTIRNCSFPNGIIIVGKVEQLRIIDSNVKIINSTLICSEISIASTSRKKTCNVECVNSFWESVKTLSVYNNSSFIYENPFKQLEVELLEVIKKSSLTLICSTVSCKSIYCTNSTLEFNNLERYYEYCNAGDTIPKYSGINFEKSTVNDFVYFLFTGDNKCIINGKVYKHKGYNNLIIKKVITNFQGKR